MNFQCPTCNITLQADADVAGKAVKCPSCGTRIEIPADFGQVPDESAQQHDAGVGVGSLPELNLSKPQGDHPANVNIWLALGIGLAVAGVVLVGVYLIPGKEDAEGVKQYPWIREFFWNRGFPQFASMIMAGWCIGILVLKILSIQRQRKAMMIQALPEHIDREVNVNNLKEFHDNLLNYPPKIRNSYMVNRIRKALEFFYVRQNNNEVNQMVTLMSDVDANKVLGSYSVVKVFLWAIPIMGFIGTVVGIGSAIGGFKDVLDGAESVEAITQGLKPILGQMGMAFDTTLLALLLSIVLAFPAAGLQGQEEDIITNVDAYCNENLMSRLNDGGAGKAQFDGDADLLRAVGEAIAENQKDVMDRFENVQSTMSTNLNKQTENYQKVAEAVDAQLAAIGDRAEKYETKLDDEYFGQISSQVKVLSEGIQNLNAVLKDLNGKQVVVKKKWFG